MSHLKSRQQEEFKKKMIILGGSLVVLLLFFMMFGLNLIIGVSQYIGGMGSKNIPTPTKNEDFLGSINIDAPPEATNSARIIVTGNANSFDKVSFYINTAKVKDAVVPSSGSFSEEIGSLKKGSNEIYIIAKTVDGKHEKQTAKYTIVFKNTKPTLEITEPSDNATVNNSDVKVAGKTDKDVEIRINSSPVVVSVQNTFQTNARLKEGDNTITIDAVDNAGNTESKTLKVTYKKE
jgi:hypothetical protein